MAARPETDTTPCLHSASQAQRRVRASRPGHAPLEATRSQARPCSVHADGATQSVTLRSRQRRHGGTAQRGCPGNGKNKKMRSEKRATARDKSPLRRQNNIAPAQSSLVVLALALFAALGLDDYARSPLTSEQSSFRPRATGLPKRFEMNNRGGVDTYHRPPRCAGG